MRAYRAGVRTSRLHALDLPGDVLRARFQGGASVSELAREYACDRRTMAIALGHYPPCSNKGCGRLSRRTQPDLCRECFNDA